MIHEIVANLTRGEVGEEVHARIDTPLFKSALAKLRNYVVMRSGGFRRRSGTRFLGRQKSAGTRVALWDAVFASDQSYVIEAGENYFRFWNEAGQVVDGGLPYEVASPLTAAQARDTFRAQDGDRMYLATPGLAPNTLSRAGHTDWSVAPTEFVDGPYLSINDTDNEATVSDVPINGTTITVTHSSTAHINGGDGFVSTDVGRHYRAQVVGRWFWGTISAVNSPTEIEVDVADGGFRDLGPVVWSGTGDELRTGTVVRLTFDASFSPPGSAPDVQQSNIGFAVKLTIWGVGVPYWAIVHRVQTGENIEVMLQSGEEPGTRRTRTWRLGAYSDTTGYPRGVETHDGRVVWINTPSSPRSVGASMSGFPSVYSPSEWDGTVTDKHGFFFEVTAGRLDEFLWVQDAPRLQLGTRSGIRSLGVNGEGVLSARNVTQKLEVNEGTSRVPPVRIGPSTIHTGRFGLSLADLVYDYNVDSLVAPELSILSRHFMDSGIIRLAYAESPEPILWALPADGQVLVGVTLDRTEKIVGFHGQTFSGVVEDIVVIPSEAERRDVLFLSVRREIDGNTVRYVETLQAPFVRKPLTDAYYVDCGATYSGAKTNVVTGVDWLEGEEVDILADGFVLPRTTIVGGELTLPNGFEAAKISFGKHIHAEGETLRAMSPSREGTTLGLKTRAAHAVIDVMETLGLKVGPRGGILEEIKYRSATTPMNQQEPMVTGTVKVSVEDTWDNGGVIRFVCDRPLPCAVRAYQLGIETQP